MEEGDDEREVEGLRRGEGLVEDRVGDLSTQYYIKPWNLKFTRTTISGLGSVCFI